MDTNDVRFYEGDCLQEMRKIEDGSIDMVFCDLPYGVTAPKWDEHIPIDELWAAYRRVLKKNGVVALFASQPFTTKLVSSNSKGFRYCWYWIKNQGTNFFHAKRMPIRKVEEICIFGGNTYYPQMTDGHVPTSSAKGCSNGNAYHGTNKRNYEGGSTTRFPTNVLDFKCVNNYARLHSAEKPVDLCAYIINTYTQPGDTVLDNCFGSGAIGVAAVDGGRGFVGIEKDPKYFQLGRERILARIDALQSESTKNG